MRANAWGRGGAELTPCRVQVGNGGEGGETVESKLAYAFALALSRQPDETEIRILRGVLGDEASPAEESESGWDLVARAILNLSEAITRQ